MPQAAPIPASPPTPEEALVAAALANDAVEVERLLKEGAPPDAGKDDLRGSAFIRAASEGYLDVVKAFTRYNVDLNLQNYDKRNAMHAAVARGQNEVALYLLERKAGFYERDRMGHFPMETAINGGAFQIVEKMIDKGYDTTLKDERGQDTMEDLIRRASWDDDGWKPALEKIAARKRAAEEELKNAAERLREWQDAVDHIAETRVTVEAPPAASFKKPKKQAFPAH